MLKSLISRTLGVIVVLFPVTSTCATAATDPLSTWVAQVNRQVDFHAQMPESEAHGVAQISFRRGPDGRAMDIVVRAGEPSVAAAAVRTAKRLHHLPPLPTEYPTDQRIVMNLLIGESGELQAYNSQRNRLLASAAVQNAKLASRIGTTQLAKADRQ